MKRVNDSFNKLDSIKNCCLTAIENLETSFTKEYQSKNIDLFESQFRGIWKIRYIENEGPVQIEDEYLLMECMPAHPFGFGSYKEARQTQNSLKEYERKMN